MRASSALASSLLVAGGLASAGLVAGGLASAGLVAGGLTAAGLVAGAGLVATLAGPADAGGRAASLLRRFKSYEVSCSTFAGFCAAAGQDLAHAAETRHMVVGRRHERDAAWWIGFDLGPGAIDAAKPIAVAVDEAAPVTFAPGTGWAITSHPGFVSIMDAAAATALLAAMAKGETVTLTATAADGGAFERPFSLAGLMASKGWIDERQKREASPLVAGPSPLERIDAATEARFAAWTRGPFPAGLLAAHRALSEAAAKDAKLIECDRPGASDDDGAVVESGVAALRLDATHTLFVVPCTWHVYQGSSAVFLGEGGDAAKIRPLALPVFDRKGGIRTTGPYVNESGFSPLFRGLWNHSRGRGADDCGEEQIWRWDGRILRIVEQHGRDCPVNGRSEDGGDGDERPEAPLAFPVVRQEKAELR